MRFNNWNRCLLAVCFAGVLVASQGVLRAQSAQPNVTPIFSVSANGMNSVQAYQGWALLLDGTIYHPNLYSMSSLVTPLFINAQNGSWANTIQLVVTDSTGATQNWPIQLAGIPLGSLSLDAANIGRLAWIVSPSDTAAIAAGTYEVTGILNTTASAGTTGWSGTRKSNQVSVQITAPPVSPTAQQQEQQAELLAYSDLFMGNTSQALVDVNILLAQQPTAFGALALKGNLLEQMGDAVDALSAYDQAVAAFYAANPGPLAEAPEGLIIHRRALRSSLLSQSGTRGQPQVAIQLLDQGVQSPGVFFLDLQITNVGNDVAENVALNQITFQTLSGTGQVFYNNMVSPPLPTFTDFLSVNASATIRIFVAAQGTVNSFSITENGAAADIFGTPTSFSQTQTVSTSFTGTIGALTITANNATQQYGQPTPPLNGATYAGFLNGDTPASLTGTLGCTTTATQSSPVGTYPITCSGQSSTAYTITYVPGALTITPAPLTVSATATTRQYGQANPPLNNVTYAGFANGDTVASLAGAVSCTTTATQASPVGAYSIVCSGLSSENYAISFQPSNLTVTPAPLAIAANSASRPYGANNPVLAGMLAGLQNGDPITANFTTAALPTSPAGAYAITPIALDPANRLGNYTLSLLNGTLSVVPENTLLSLVVSPSSISVGQSAIVTVTLTAPDMVIPIPNDPTVLAPVSVASPVASDVLSNDGTCVLVPSPTPGSASCTVSVTSIEPNGRTLNASFIGSADLAGNSGTVALTVTAPLQGQQSCIQSDFRNLAVAGGNYLWFNSVFRARGVSEQLVHISFFQGSVQFQYTDASGNLVRVSESLPDAHITIDPNAAAASTAFDSASNVWNTTIPWDIDDNAFLTGMPWLVPAGGIPGDIEPVTVCGTFASDVANIDIGWRWAAAAYSSFSSDATTLGVKPVDTDRDNQGNNRDRAGTPEIYKQFVIPGARGKGGTNFTGSYSHSNVIE